MTTHTQKAHYEYTLNEWNHIYYQEYLDIIFKENNINIIYDIGANVGGTTSIFIEYCKNKNKNFKKIYCFEPDTENMNFLKKKLKKEIDNNLVECIEKGIYYGKTEARVFGMGHVEEKIIHKNVGGYGIEECMIEVKNNRVKNGENVFCDQIDSKIFQLDTLENLSKNFHSPDFIKIDVEGAEKNILMHSDLIKNAKYIIVEWNHSDDIDFFVKTYLPQFKIISSKCECDILLKNVE
jgi:FkbM family methyltransferase